MYVCTLYIYYTYIIYMYTHIMHRYTSIYSAYFLRPLLSPEDPPTKLINMYNIYIYLRVQGRLLPQTLRAYGSLLP